MTAFNGDTHLEQSFRVLILKHEIKTVVETGTHHGGTTEALAGMAEKVITIEKHPGYYEQARSYLSRFENVKCYLGDSGGDLDFLTATAESPVLYFLDAHWGSHCPIMDELWQIHKTGGKPVIVIHDFFNPEHPEFGYDTWDVGRLDWKLIHSGITDIYGENNFRHSYNQEASG